MTMPHLENCLHDENGWCLDCVKLLHDDMELCQVINAKVNAENNALRTALKTCREFMRSQVITTRMFASMCGITPSQLSEWIADPIREPPDFVERSRE